MCLSVAKKRAPAINDRHSLRFIVFGGQNNWVLALLKGLRSADCGLRIADSDSGHRISDFAASEESKANLHCQPETTRWLATKFLRLEQLLWDWETGTQDSGFRIRKRQARMAN